MKYLIILGLASLFFIVHPTVVQGQEVRLLVQKFQSAGNYTVVWDGRDAAGRQVSTGMYVYRLQAGADVVTRKMLLAK